MTMIIDISEELYAKVPTLVNKGSIWIGDVLDAVKNGTPLEQHRNITNEEMYQQLTHLEAENERLHDALEAQPTDVVSRSEAINSIKYKSDVEKKLRNQNRKYTEGYDDVRWIKGYEEGLDDAITIINSLPPVHPQPCEDAVSRSEAITELTALIENFKGIQGDMGSAINSARELIKTLSIVMPQRKKGKWIEVNRGIHVTDYRCSECGRIVRDDTGYDVSADYPYCHCGAKMEVILNDKK